MYWTSVLVTAISSAAAIGAVINEFRKQNKKRTKIDILQTQQINDIKK